MSSLLKDIYSVSFLRQFSSVVKTVVPSFSEKEFQLLVMDENWSGLELKGRMKHISRCLHRFMPEDYSDAAKTIKDIIGQLRKSRIAESGIEFMFFPEYIEMFGQDHYEASVDLIEFVTQLTSCEFAVRPFLIRYGQRMTDQMISWSVHPNHKVRRLASEGARPRLPWAMALPAFRKDPAPILPLLENLKADESEWVRRSVANNLNDISKDHPEIVMELAEKWKGTGADTDALVRHGCRGLLKRAHAGALAFYGLGTVRGIQLSGLEVLTPKVKVGESLSFSFTVRNENDTEHKLRLEYAIYYVKHLQKTTRKVFKISERSIGAGQSIDFVRNQSFKPITTRRYYPGMHRVAVICNGEELAEGCFELK